MREDLNLKEYAESLGYTPTEPTSGSSVENGGNYTFNKGNVSVWRIRDGWQTAQLISSHYKNHKKFDSLKDALNRNYSEFK